MPLTECPDCGGVVSDAALTCPTCHRVLTSVGQKSVTMKMIYVRWTIVGAAAMIVIWTLIQLLA